MNPGLFKAYNNIVVCTSLLLLLAVGSNLDLLLLQLLAWILEDQFLLWKIDHLSASVVVLLVCVCFTDESLTYFKLNK